MGAFPFTKEDFSPRLALVKTNYCLPYLSFKIEKQPPPQKKKILGREKKLVRFFSKIGIGRKFSALSTAVDP